MPAQQSHIPHWSDNVCGRTENEDALGKYPPTISMSSTRRGGSLWLSRVLGHAGRRWVCGRIHTLRVTRSQLSTAATCLREANRAVYEKAQRDPTLTGNGTNVYGAGHSSRPVHMQRTLATANCFEVMDRVSARSWMITRRVAEMVRGGLNTKDQARKHRSNPCYTGPWVSNL